MRVAIVGVGPKGLFAFERLLARLSEAGPDSEAEIDLFEPHPFPGAGPNYDPEQPEYLLMNFAAEHVDLWWPSGGSVPAFERRSFLDWSATVGERIDGRAYPPRAAVGRYLADGFDVLRRCAPPWVTVRVRPSRVDAVCRSGPRWSLVAGGGSAGSYDEVLIATGHVAGSPYPVESWLGRERIPAGTSVGVRGFALTFIDVALALTEGRGGSFAALDHPFRLRYLPPAEPVGTIVPFSRTGRPTLAKPGPSIAAAVEGLGELATRARSELMGLDGPVALSQVRSLLEQTAEAYLVAAGIAGVGDPAAWLDEATSGSPTSSLAAYDELEHSLSVGCGLAPPGLLWALGEMWRSLYPALVARLGGDGLRARDWPAFRHLAAEFERIAFGPAPVNAAKLLALVDAGQVDLGSLTGGAVSEVVVDAVLPAPGVPRGTGSLTEHLVADGHARIAPFRRGLEIGPDAGCLAADGATVPGLAAIGRPTEDWVIGNDTLNRALHPQVDLWAIRVADRCRLAQVV